MNLPDFIDFIKSLTVVTGGGGHIFNNQKMIVYIFQNSLFVVFYAYNNELFNLVRLLLIFIIGFSLLNQIEMMSFHRGTADFEGSGPA